MSLNAPVEDDTFDDYDSDGPGGSSHHRKSLSKQSGAGAQDGGESNVTKRTLQNRESLLNMRGKDRHALKYSVLTLPL